MSKLTIIVFFLTLSCTQIYDWQTKYPDNFAEEYLEDFIKDTTGYDADLTPISGKEKQTFKQSER